MTTDNTYQFNTPTNSMTFYTKSSMRFYAGASTTANTSSNTVSVGVTGVLDATLLGAKITTFTPLMLTLSGSLAYSAELQSGFKFKYTGIGCEQSTAETESALAETNSALADVKNTMVSLETEPFTLANRAADLIMSGISVVP
ncbi:MAG: hypothetical protein ACT7A5_05645 [Ferrovibrionaceae bacterium]